MTFLKRAASCVAALAIAISLASLSVQKASANHMEKPMPHSCLCR